MGHKHRVGPIEPVFVPVKLTSTVPTNTINIGDLIAMVSGFAVNAVNFAWDTDIATTRAAFVAAFIGVSQSRSIAGSTDERDLMIAVDTRGEFDVDLTASATLNANTGLMVSKAAGNALVNTVETNATYASNCFVITKTMTAAGVVARARLCNALADK